MSDATRLGGPAQAHADTSDGQEGGGAKSSAAELASEARGAVSRVGDEAAAVVQDVKAEGTAVIETARGRATGFAEEQKEAGAEQADNLARAVHRAADELQGTSPQIAQYVHEAASSVDHLARALRDRSPGELIGGVEDLARRQPVAFFGAAVLAGFALARFAKSSAQDARPSVHNTGSAYGTRSTQSQSPPFGESRGSTAVGGGVANPRSVAMGAPGWVSDPDRPQGEAAARPATMAAASLGGAAARPAATTTDRTGPGRQGG